MECVASRFEHFNHFLSDAKDLQGVWISDGSRSSGAGGWVEGTVELCAGLVDF